MDGALFGPLRVLDGRGVSEMEMAGGKVPIFRLVASCVARSYSRTSSMVMSVGMKALRVQTFGRELHEEMRRASVSISVYDAANLLIKLSQ